MKPDHDQMAAKAEEEIQKITKFQSDAVKKVEAELAAVSENGPDTRFSKMMDVIHYEGQKDIWNDFKSLIEKKPSTEEIYEKLLKWLLRGPDDQWSGRSNDSRRIKFDGERDAIREILEFVQWGF
jgi:hypothetical protein